MHAIRSAAIVLTLCGSLLLGACGQREELAPAAGAKLPPAPYGRSTAPTANRLLQPPTLAIPERSVELRTRSEQRDDDPFDLPPPERPVSPAPAPSPTTTATP